MIVIDPEHKRIYGSSLKKDLHAEFEKLEEELDD